MSSADLPDVGSRYALNRTGSGADHAAQASFRKDGYAVLDGLAEPGMIGSCRTWLEQRNPSHFAAAEGDGRLWVSDQRFHVPVTIDGPFANPWILSNPRLETVLAGLLGHDFVIDSFGMIVSLPGSPDQGLHSDGEMLFPDTGISHIIPPYAITVAIPMVPMNPQHGSTGFCTGSHIKREAGPPELDCAPMVPVGSAVLWDYRVIHAGIANRSSVPRPLIYITYCRYWWADTVNFSYLSEHKLVASRKSVAAMSEGLRGRIGRAVLVD